MRWLRSQVMKRTHLPAAFRSQASFPSTIVPTPLSPNVPGGSLNPCPTNAMWTQEVRPNVDPRDLASPCILLVRLDVSTVHFLRYVPGQTVTDVIRAESAIDPIVAQSFWYDVLGMHVDEQQMLRPRFVLVVSAQPLISPALSQLDHLQVILFQVARPMAVCLQHSFVAVDELKFYLRALASTTGVDFVEPLIVSNQDLMSTVSDVWLNQLHETVVNKQVVFSVMLLNHHWVPIVVGVHDSQVFVSAPALGLAVWQNCLSCASARFDLLQSAIPHPVEAPQAFPHCCGFQAVWWLHGTLTESAMVTVTPEVASEMRYNFLISLLGPVLIEISLDDLLLGGGISPELQNAVTTILKEHGVPETSITTRVNHVVDSLGTPQLEKIFRSPRPWIAMKHAANACQPPVQLVLATELQEVLALRAKDPKPVGDKKRKQNKVPIDVPPSLPRLGPQDVVIPEGVFRQQDGIALSQLKIADLSPSARGVIVGTERDLHAYISKPTLSSEGLGLIVMDPSSELLHVSGPMLRFPICCALTQEPMLISALLLQKGQKKVERNLPEARVKVHEQANQVFKVLLFRDEVADWSQVIKAPVRCVLELLPGLAVCHQVECKCPKRHVPEAGEVDEAVLDVWNRDFITYRFARVGAQQADMYACTIRVASSFAKQVFRSSGTNGLYVEPRAVDGKREGEAYHTIWLPKKSLEEVRAEQAALREETFIVRIQKKYGLGMSVPQAEAVHQHLKGTQPFLPGGAKQVWILGPLPWGTTRKSVTQLLQQWSWQGKPLQPSGRAADGSGLMWSVQSIEPPPHTVYSLAHGDIVLTRADKPLQAAPITPQVEASRHTRDSLAGGLQAVDPLSINDPWGGPRAASSQSASRTGGTSGVTHAHLANLEASILAKVSQQKHEQTGEDSVMEGAWEQRVAALESQVQQLSTVQQAQSHQTASVAAQVAQLNSKIDMQSQSIESKLDQKMSEQMQRIESLLCKRARETREWQRRQGSSCKSQSQPCSIWTFVRMLWWVVVFGFLRVGEAAVPGRWTLGAINPTGLSGKTHLLVHIPQPAILACSETALTEVGQFRFQGELHRQSPNLSFVAGAPAPYRSQSPQAVGGKQVGVGFLSSFPARSIHQGWDPESYQTSRVASSRFFVGSEWISGGVLYGFAHRSETKEVQQATDQLLSQVVLQVCHRSNGCRFIAGDFNQRPGVLASMRYLYEQGWADLQDLAQVRWGVQPVATCKNTTRKDFVLLSPEMQSALIGVRVISDVFPDHAILLGTFKDQVSSPWTRVWPKVCPIQWNSDTTSAVREKQVTFLESIHDDPSQELRQVCEAFESHVHCQLQSSTGIGLLPNQRGRASRTKPQWMKSQPLVLRPSRHGERIPADFATLRYKRMFTQYRRLCSYARLMRVQAPSLSHRAHALQLWRAIWRAPGFAPSFAKWWPNRSTCSLGAPPIIPVAMPPYAVANAILAAFEVELKEVERQMFAKGGKHKVPTNPYAVFRDLKGPRALSVQSLASRKQATVCEIREDNSIVFDPPDALSPGLPLYGPDGHLEYHHLDTDQVWLATETPLTLGDVLVQEKFIGDTEELHIEFEHEWFRRWDRHLHVPHDRWDPIGEFIDRLPPSACMELRPVTVDRWRSFVQSRKKRSAVGLDSLSRMDLLAFPDSLVERVLGLYATAEATSHWPLQWTAGEVHSLQKVSDASTVQQYRPITIFALGYRIWSSLRSREALQFLHPLAPSSLWGSRPGASAPAFWWHLQSLLERAIYEGQVISGWIQDIIKAFNMIPRDPIFRAAIHFGLSPGLVRGWAGFVGATTRFFVIRSTLSEGLRSCTGYPEGCGMSVVAMFLANLVIHRWFSMLWPQLELHSYVDNIELLEHGEGSLESGLHSLTALMRLFDLELDEAKSYAWSLHSATRQALRRSGHRVKLSAKDLGGHMQYCRKFSNHTVTRACGQLETFWDRLGRSRANRSAKLRAIRAAAWPKALHCIAITPLGDRWYEKLRTGAARATGLARSGSKPLVQLSLLESPASDPEFHALWNSVSLFRRYGQHDQAEEVMCQALELPPKHRPPGPVGLMLSRLQKLGNTLDHHQQPLDLLRSPPQELKWRLVEGWQHYVGTVLMPRKDFDGLQCVAPALTKRSLAKLAPDHCGFVRALLDGTHLTSDMPYCDVDQCPLCGLPDSRHHRHWECVHTATSRQNLTFPAGFPECTRERGWAILPRAVVDFRAALLVVPSQLWTFAVSSDQLPFEGCVDLFTDGTARCPTDPYVRLAAWAVVLGSSHDRGHPVRVSSGVVTGLSQTAFRGELSALISAVAFAMHVHRSLKKNGPLDQRYLDKTRGKKKHVSNLMLLRQKKGSLRHFFLQVLGAQRLVKSKWVKLYRNHSITLRLMKSQQVKTPSPQQTHPLKLRLAKSKRLNFHKRSTIASDKKSVDENFTEPQQNHRFTLSRLVKSEGAQTPQALSEIILQSHCMKTNTQQNHPTSHWGLRQDWRWKLPGAQQIIHQSVRVSGGKPKHTQQNHRSHWGF